MALIQVKEAACPANSQRGLRGFASERLGTRRSSRDGLRVHLWLDDVVTGDATVAVCPNAYSRAGQPSLSFSWVMRAADFTKRLLLIDLLKSYFKGDVPAKELCLRTREIAKPQPDSDRSAQIHFSEPPLHSTASSHLVRCACPRNDEGYRIDFHGPAFYGVYS